MGTIPIFMLRLLPILLIFAAATALADEGYRLRIAASAQHGVLTLTPYASGPAGKLRYEVRASKEGQSGKASSAQSGQVDLAAGRESALSTLSFELRSDNRYVVSVRLLKGDAVLAEAAFRYPQ